MSDEEVNIDLQLLARIMLGEDQSASARARMVGGMQQVYFRAGETLYRRGDAPTQFYIVTDGTVELRGEEDLPWRLEARAFVGVFDAHLQRDHTRTAVAVTDLRAAAVSAAYLLEVFETNFDLAMARMGGMSRSVFELTVTLIEQGFDPFARDEDALQRCDGFQGQCSPRSATQPLNPFERLLALHLCPTFAAAGMQSLIRLERLAEEQFVEAGGFVMEEGDATDRIYLVTHGSVVISNAAGDLHHVSSAPEVIGDVVVFGCDTWPVQALATDAVRLLVLKREDVYDVMEDHHTLSNAVTRFLLRRMEQLQLLRLQQSDAAAVEPQGDMSLEKPRALGVAPG